MHQGGTMEEVRPRSGLLPPPRRRRGTRLAAVVVLGTMLFGAGAIGSGAVGGGTELPALVRRPPSHVSSAATRPVPPGGSLRDEIAALQARLELLPGDWRSWAALGLAYVQQARITADPRFYPRAEGALARSRSIRPRGNFEAFTGEGALALARHDFARALRWGERARRVNPYNANVHGVIGDALVELGRYQRAFATFQHMVDLRPDLSSYARASYALELQGDVPAAVRAMRLALGAAGTPEDQAFAAYQLGELFFGTGRVGRAASFYRRAAGLAPAYAPPRAGLAKVAWARGDRGRAIRRYAAIVARYPLPEYVIALGDLYAAAGDRTRAERQYGLVRVEERLFRAAGVDVDLELALFEADHGDPATALRAARAEWRRRHGVLVADALAWALHRNGRDAEALRYSRFARKLGYRNALIHFHAGTIELSMGRRRAGLAELRTARRINPCFSIRYSSVADRIVARAP